MTTNSKPLTQIQTVCAELKTRGAREIEIRFAGEGDEGSIQNIEAKGVELSANEQQILDEWAYQYLEDHCTIDWYNNEGGGGSIRIYLNSGKIELNSYFNTIEHHDQPTHEGRL